MTKYLLIKYLLGILVVFSLTFPSIAGCPTKVSEEQFDEINKSVTEEHLPEVMQNCTGPCTYHAEASVYIMRHGGTAPVEGFEFFPKQRVEAKIGRNNMEMAVSYMSTSDEEAIKINGVRISRADLLAEKNEEINFLDEDQRNTYRYYVWQKFKIPDTLDMTGGISFLKFGYPKSVIKLLNEIKDNEPFFMSLMYETPSGNAFGHALPAMKYVEPVTGIKKIRLGLQQGSQGIPYNNISSFKSGLTGMINSVLNNEVKSIHRITIMQPLP